MIVILLGSPGAGKGTVSQKMCEKYNFVHMSSGDLMRKEISSGSNLGAELKKVLASGAFADDHLTFRIVKNFLVKRINENIILDGFPRTIVQANLFKNFLHNNNSKLTAVIYLDISLAVATDRLTSRRICPKCNWVYNTKLNPPKIPEICDFDGTKLIQRTDDKPAVVKKRFETYQVLAKPLIDYYENEPYFYTLDASDKLTTILNKIENILNLSK